MQSVLLVDDNLAHNYLHHRLIGKQKIVEQIVVKTSAMEALYFLRMKNRPRVDILFLDLNMPDMDGFEFLEEYERLSTEYRAGKLIVLSSSACQKDKMKAFSEFKTVEGYIEKPLMEEDLKRIFATYLSHIEDGGLGSAFNRCHDGFTHAIKSLFWA